MYVYLLKLNGIFTLKFIKVNCIKKKNFTFTKFRNIYLIQINFTYYKIIVFGGNKRIYLIEHLRLHEFIKSHLFIRNNYKWTYLEI